tara:strand:+ start:60 stop:1598 length:1539 start_codon:yes stop_codon:yes gene_type:complete
MAPPFKGGTKEQFDKGEVQFILPDNQKTNPVIATKNQTTRNIGGTVQTGAMGSQYVSGGTDITHTSVTFLTKDNNGIITGAKRVLFIENDKSEWVPAAVSTNGGRSYTFSDPDYPLMATGGPNGGPTAGAALKRDLNEVTSDIHKNLDTQTNESFERVGADELGGREKAIASIANNADVVKTNEEAAARAAANTGNDDGDGVTSVNVDPLDAQAFRDNVGTKSRTKTYGNSVYPLELGQTKQDVIRITLLEYEPKDFSAGGPNGNFGFSDRTDFRSGKRNALGTVTLPIPGGIQDTNSVVWAGQQMNAVEAALANVALTSISENPLKGLDEARKIGQTVIGSGNNEVVTGLANMFAGAASGTGGQLLTRTTGAVINPNLELLFSGPSLRTFSFKFKLNAREKRETREIVKIIRFFKQGSAPQKSPVHLFLKSPHTFGIQYLHRGEDDNENPFMGKIKECALQSVTVNYTPEGNYATFPDGAMTSYELTLGFSELEPIFNSDYPDDNDASIGF